MRAFRTNLKNKETTRNTSVRCQTLWTTQPQLSLGWLNFAIFEPALNQETPRSTNKQTHQCTSSSMALAWSWRRIGALSCPPVGTSTARLTVCCAESGRRTWADVVYQVETRTLERSPSMPHTLEVCIHPKKDMIW